MPAPTDAEIAYLWGLLRPLLPTHWTREEFERVLEEPKPDSPFQVNIEGTRIEATLANSFVSFERIR